MLNGNNFYPEDGGFTVNTDLEEANNEVKQKEPFSKRKELFEWLDVITLALIIVVVIFGFLFRVATIEGDSMLNTLHGGEMVVISNFSYTPEYGDIVVISRNIENSASAEAEGQGPIIKRIIATENQTVDIDFDKGEIEAVVTVTGHTPSRHHFSYMSDGLQSMINIVSEIAHRCIELNGCLGHNAVKMTPGVVMIDEIDLYLHPHWQKHVLQDLTKAFPMIQFIVSTHSPFIVQSLQEGQLVSFDDNVLTSGEPFREGLEDIASERMGLQQDIRSKRFNEMVDVATRLFEAADNGSANKDELKAKLDEIEAEFSDDPAYLALIRTELKAKVK